jgi:hypothetical protein
MDWNSSEINYPITIPMMWNGDRKITPKIECSGSFPIPATFWSHPRILPCQIVRIIRVTFLPF